MYNLLTSAGMERLKVRLHDLKMKDLARAQEEVVRSRDEGKLEENESYLHAQENYKMVERRIAELSDVVDNYEVFLATPSTDHVGFGSTVLVEDTETQKQRRITLVGEPEADIKLGSISITSPLGSALMGAVVGDVVEVVVPRGQMKYEVIEITVA
jgi:transcription elongation factor GreA